MFPRIIEVRATGDYQLQLVFSDGTSGQVDLRNWVVGQGGVFKPLEEPDYFKQVIVNPELGTVQWPNGADFCPDVLYSLVTGRPILSPESASL
jgi:hypothetical protein